MVVGGEQHIKARVPGAVHQGIGAVKLGIAGIGKALVRTAQGSFQIGNGVVRLAGIGGDVAEDALKIVAAVLLLAAVDDLLVHQQITGGENGGGGNGRRGSLGFGGITDGLYGTGRRLLGVLFFPGAQAQRDDGNVRDSQNRNQDTQNDHNGGAWGRGTALICIGHGKPPVCLLWNQRISYPADSGPH